MSEGRSRSRWIVIGCVVTALTAAASAAQLFGSGEVLAPIPAEAAF
jgi:hypothetical protein